MQDDDSYDMQDDDKEKWPALDKQLPANLQLAVFDVAGTTLDDRQDGTMDKSSAAACTSDIAYPLLSTAILTHVYKYTHPLPIRHHKHPLPMR